MQLDSVFLSLNESFPGLTAELSVIKQESKILHCKQNFAAETSHPTAEFHLQLGGRVVSRL